MTADPKQSPGTSEQYDVSVIICTYNRCHYLHHSLESVLAQKADGLRYEVILVDNNSTDRTREVVESFLARGHANLRYVFEGRQGKPYALNTGIALANAPLVGFTDDDVHVAPDWLLQIKRAFDEHPDVSFVGGKVKPNWPTPPPKWLTREHWAPLAISDFGEQSFYVNMERPQCLVGANLAVRRAVLEHVGPFDPVFRRTQDHQWQLRAWRQRLQGMYIPGMVVTADVQPERLTKAYHRRWHATHGKYGALMQLNESIAPDGRLRPQVPSQMRMFFGVPAFIYRQLPGEAKRWLLAALRGDESSSFQHANRMRDTINYIGKRWRTHNGQRQHSFFAECTSFSRAILGKK